MTSFLALNTINDYLTAFGIFLTTLLVLLIVRKLIVGKLHDKKLGTIIQYITRELDWPLYLTLGLYFGILFLTVPQSIMKWINYIFYLILIIHVILIIQHLIDYFIKRHIEKKGPQNSSLLKFLGNLAKVVVWLVIILLVVSNLGYNITSLLAGLGIAGIAIALALQNVLGDLFAAVTIYLDKPFKEGDFIVIGEHLGIVKKIGIKTTRIESLWGEELIISNTELTSTRIKNYKKMKRRRIHFEIGVTYQTPSSKIKKGLEIIKQIFKEVKDTELDRVHFKAFGDFNLKYEIAYYIDSNDYTKYMDIQQDINLKIKERFEKAKIEFAYPTQTLYLNKN